MKSYKKLLNEWAQKTNLLHEITDVERIILHKTLLEIYQDIARIANDNGLTVLLAGGSALGAIRHKGFIPWDDDLDIMMSRQDYNKFIKLLQVDILGKNYEYRFPDGIHDTTCCFLKIYKKNTIFTGIGQKTCDIPQGIFIDIFPFDHTPKNYLIRSMKGIIANVIRLISNCIQEYSNLDDTYIEEMKQYPDLYFVIKKRLILGKMFSFINHKKLVYLFDRFVSNEKTDGLICIPTGRKLYNGEVFNYDDFLPGTHAKFEGLDVLVPTNIDAYLKNLYNNYMKLPPLTERERHFISKFEV